MRKLKIWAVVMLLLYVGLAAMAYSNQERLVFFPTKMPMNHAFDFCQQFEEIYLTAEDGARLNAVHIKQDSAKGTILYFHGNSGNISHLIHVANLFTRNGFASVLVDYRTFGKSTGEMSEQALYSDAQLFYDYILNSESEEDVILYGRSFGTGIATWLASKNSPKRLILESPFNSAVELGQHRFPFLPIDWLSEYRFPSDQYVKDVRCPIFIFHGTEDSVIPYEQAEKLYEAIPGTSKSMFAIEGGGHNYLQDDAVFKKGMAEALR